ncbi:MAG: sulfurtransferase [Deltaproteobacteria bacterium]|nr:sulfurtransferase [Deltaproteobacteria bacterium]
MAIKDLTPEQLRQFIQQHNEKNYLLLDVRQPDEYEEFHIPGARLIPLPELVQTVDSLPADKTLIFYCHVGGRSLAAASMAEEEIRGAGDIYNLSGGIMAWDRATVSNQPNVQLFDGQGPSEMFRTAMNLEKGAMRFYTHIRDTYPDPSWSEVFGRLAKAEIAHAKTVHETWERRDAQLEPFEKLFKELDGEVLEGGLLLKVAMTQLASAGEQTCLRMLEMALKIEYTAYDLYRNLTHQLSESEGSAVFLSIAQAEKGHMRALIDAIEGC